MTERKGARHNLDGRHQYKRPRQQLMARTGRTGLSGTAIPWAILMLGMGFVGRCGRNSPLGRNLEVEKSWVLAPLAAAGAKLSADPLFDGGEVTL